MYFIFISFIAINLTFLATTISPATTTSYTTTQTPATQTALPGGSFFNYLSTTYLTQLAKFPQHIIDIKDTENLEKIDTSSTAKRLVKITGLPFGLFDSSLFNTNRKQRGTHLLALLRSKYGKEMIKWHFAGEGSKELPKLANHKHPSKFLSFEKAVNQMLQQEIDTETQTKTTTTQLQQEIPHNSLSTSSLPVPSRPTFYHHQTNTSNISLLDLQLLNMNITKTPLYAFASSGFFMVMEWYDPITGDLQLEGCCPPPIHNTIVEKMMQDNIFSSDVLKNVLPLFLKIHLNLNLKESTTKKDNKDNTTKDDQNVEQEQVDIDIYFATHMSGTHFHTHGAAVTSTTGNKLWMFFTPEMQHDLKSKSHLLLQAGLAPICSEQKGEKYHLNSSSCFGQFHSLEILRAYEVMLDLGIAPLLVVQKPEEIFVIPETWMHATVNLEAGVSVSWRFLDGRIKIEEKDKDELVMDIPAKTTKTKTHVDCQDQDEHWEVKPNEGVSAHVKRIPMHLFTKKRWLEDFYPYGRPVVITNATSEWKLWKVVEKKQLNEMLYKHWGSSSSSTSYQSMYNHLPGYLMDNLIQLDTSHQIASDTFARIYNKSSSSFDFSEDYIMLPEIQGEQRPFTHLFEPKPKFLPIPLDWKTFGSFYVGGKDRGTSRHQDYYSCLVGWQVQVTGIKRWRIQMPLKSYMVRDWPKKAFIDIDDNMSGPNTVVYDFNVFPRELLIWFPQFFHNTTVVSTTTSLSLVSHFGSKNISFPSLFYKSFYAATQCHSSLKSMYEHCFADWFG